MRLLDLDPRWLIEDGRRVGFVFRCPTNKAWWQSCFVASPKMKEQWRLIEASLPPDEKDMFQACIEGTHWQIADGIDAADFETISVTPSLDGSKGGLWHGHITKGKVVGGI